MCYISVKVPRCLPLIHAFCLFFFIERYIYIFMSMEGERMKDGEFLLREKGDGMISRMFIAVEISVSPFPFLMCLLHCLWDLELV